MKFILSYTFRIGLFLIFMPLFAGADNCNSAGFPQNPTSIDECDKAYSKQEKSCESTQDQTRLLDGASSCLKKVMNEELDKRLVPLKKTDLNQFQKEMKLQAAFNSGVSNHCGNLCLEGTQALPAFEQCQMSLIRKRIQQAIAINNKSLSIQSKPNNKKYKLNEAPFEEFSRELCRMPSTIWKDRKRPENCEKLVIQELFPTTMCFGDQK